MDANSRPKPKADPTRDTGTGRDTLDECGRASVYARQNSADHRIVNVLNVHDNTLNGQTVTLHGLEIDGDNGIPAATKFLEPHDT